MRIRLLACGVAFALSAATLSPVFAASATVVNVKLEDTSTNGTMSNMHMTLDQNVIKAGPVTFHAVNESKTLIHEAIVVKIDPKHPSLAYDAKKNRVIESRIKHLGEISDLKPGASGSITLKLTPGSYVLICNQPGHYKAGMSAAFTVQA